MLQQKHFVFLFFSTKRDNRHSVLYLKKQCETTLFSREHPLFGIFLKKRI
ncbi:hypothetical protein BREVNS_1918 [Brevinematales bacterium NS]|nr:hypothetical protein BREVNS_1918 [Brevinematales bacterium NS]